MNGGRRPNQGRGTANQNEPGRGKHPHLSRRGTIQITMINIIHIPTGRDGMRRGGTEIIREMITEENCNRFTNLEVLVYGRTKEQGDGHGSSRGLMG